MKQKGGDSSTFGDLQTEGFCVVGRLVGASFSDSVAGFKKLPVPSLTSTMWCVGCTAICRSEWIPGNLARARGVRVQGGKMGCSPQNSICPPPSLPRWYRWVHELCFGGNPGNCRRSRAELWERRVQNFLNRIFTTFYPCCSIRVCCVWRVEIRQSQIKQFLTHLSLWMQTDDLFGQIYSFLSVWKIKSWLHFSVIPSTTVTFWLSTSSQQQASVRTGYLYFVLLDFASLQCTVVHFEEVLFIHLIMKSILNWDRVNHWVSLASSWERFSFSLT